MAQKREKKMKFKKILTHHEASLVGKKEVVDLLLTKGADVNAKNKNCWSPLYCAASMGHKDVVELLINKGAAINAKNNDGSTHLHNATCRGHKDVVELLIHLGANNSEDEYVVGDEDV